MGFSLIFRGALSFRRDQLVATIESIVSKKSNLWLFFILCGAEAYLIISGKITFGGVQTEDIDSFRVSPIAVLALPFSYAALIIAGYMMHDSSRTFWTRYFFKWVLLSQFSFVLLGGRRLAAIALMLAFLGLCVSRVSRRRIVIILSVFLVIFTSSFCLFYALRVAGYSDDLRGVAKFDRVKGQVSRLDTVFSDNNSQLSFAESLRENVTTRPFIIGYFAMLCKGSGVGVHGQVMKASIATAVPSVIWRGKDAIMADGNEENLAYQAFALPRLTDEANTIITSGYTDLVIIGPFFYITVVLGFLALASWLLKQRISPESKLIIFSYFVVLCLSFENTFSTWFVALRDMGIYVIFFWAWNKFMHGDAPTARTRHAGRGRSFKQ